ncbi:MAG: hypothetical protein SGPRY_010494 [Prymnesium sp.]
MLRRPALEQLSVGVSQQRSGSSSSLSSHSPHSATKLSESGRFVIGGYEITREGVSEAKGSARGDDAKPEGSPEIYELPGVAAAIFDQLQPLEIVGRGASSFVRRAEHKEGRAVAIKSICISDASRRKQIFNEISLLRAQNPDQIRHLIQFLGVRYCEGSIQIAMEFMDAGSLGDLLCRSGALSQECIGTIFRQTLLALDELKERHLVHRDLKPQNILLNLRGQCKVSDFGCVAELQDSFGKCGTFVGTVPYMSPERIKGEEYSCAKLPIACPASHPLCFTSFPPLCDFADYCLRKLPEERPAARMLLQHPFIKHYGEESSGFRLDQFLQEASVRHERAKESRALHAAVKSFASSRLDEDLAAEVEEELVITDEGGGSEEEEPHATGAISTVQSEHLSPANPPKGMTMGATRAKGGEDKRREEERCHLVARNDELESEIASARQELQALHHANSQLQMQVQGAHAIGSFLACTITACVCLRQLSSSQQLIVQLRHAVNQEASVAPPLASRKSEQLLSDYLMLDLDASELQRMHPTDLERLAAQTERNLLSLRSALRQRGRKLSGSASAGRARQPLAGDMTVAGGRVPLSSRPMSVNTFRVASAAHLTRCPSPPGNGRPPSAASSERRSSLRPLGL